MYFIVFIFFTTEKQILSHIYSLVNLEIDPRCLRIDIESVRDRQQK